MAVLTKKIRLLPVGDKEEIDRVYQYLKDAQYEQYRYMNKLMSQVAMTYYKYDKDISNPDFKAEINEIYRASNFAFKEAKNPKGLGMQGSATMRVKQDFSTALKNGLAKGERNLPQYKRDFPVLVAGRFLTPRKEARIITESDGKEREIEEYFFKFVNKIEFKAYIPQRKWSDINVKTTLQNLDHIINEDEGYKLCGSQIKIENGKIFLYLAVSYPTDKEYEPIEGKTMGVALGYSSPVVCYIDGDDEAVSLGNGEDFITRRKEISDKLSRMQSSCSEARGGHGRKRKLEAFEKYRHHEENFRKTFNHTLSKQIIDLAVKNKVSHIIVEDPLGVVVKDFPVMLRNWSFYDLEQKLEYKAKMYGITVEKKGNGIQRKCSVCAKSGKTETGSLVRLNPEDYWNTNTEFDCPVCGTRMDNGENKARLLAYVKPEGKKEKKKKK